MTQTIGSTNRDVLLVVDIQNDFCPVAVCPCRTGTRSCRSSIGSPGASSTSCSPRIGTPPAIAPSRRRPARSSQLPYGEQVLWPDHCVQGTFGADFHPGLTIPRAELVLRKGYHRDIDSYSAFFENDRATPTGLAGYLRERQLTRVSSLLGSRSTSACAIRRKTPAGSASRWSSSRTPAVASTSTAPSRPRGGTSTSWPSAASRATPSADPVRTRIGLDQDIHRDADRNVASRPELSAEIDFEQAAIVSFVAPVIGDVEAHLVPDIVGIAARRKLEVGDLRSPPPAGITRGP